MSDEAPSKSARKREAHRLQALGRELAELNDEQRARIPVSDELARAVDEFRRIRSFEAKRRQLQFIGRLMRGEDADVIAAAIDDARGTSPRARYAREQCERWRERLLADDAALTDYVAEHPHTDVQTLRNLIRKARSETGEAEPYRALFRFIRDDQDADAAPHRA
jgi:ribosome-associated protein